MRWLVWLLAVGTAFGQTVIIGVAGAGSSSGSSSSDILASNKPTGTIGSSVVKNLSVANGAKATILATVTGSGYISELTIFTNQYATEIIVTVDGEATPSIDLNIAELFGDDYCDTQPAFNGKWISCSNAGSGGGSLGGTFRIPIPFSSSVKVEAKNNSGGASAILTGHIIYHTGVPDTWPYTQHLYAVHSVTSSIAINAEVDMVNVATSKRGKLLGLGWIYDGFPGAVAPNRAYPLEGPFRIYLDGSSTANYATGGSEDLFGEGWYFAQFDNFGNSPNGTNAAYAQVTGQRNTAYAPGSTDNILTIKNANTWGAQRFFINDPITFNTGQLRFTWQCGNSVAASFTGTCQVRSTVYYYTEN